MHIAGKSIVLVLGGVRSGKSRFAQQLAERSRDVIFVATAERRDDEEMRAKIERHRSERPTHWQTIEEPRELSRVLESIGTRCNVVLIDCLTLYAANMLEVGCGDEQTVSANVEALCSMLTTTQCSVILVSNEVGSGVVPAYVLGRRFRDLVGEINQQVAAVADTVLLMVAGLPMILKGALPGEQQ